MRNILLAGVAVVILAGAIFIGYENYQLTLAHSTFDNYYRFRGCKELVSRSDTSGTCKTADGNTIKIVKFHGAWYLNDDLPYCLGNFCF